MVPTIVEYYADRYRHLVCLPYSIENLHLMAQDLNIDKCFFEYSNNGGLGHYDIPAKRIDEIMAKCTLVTKSQIVGIIKNNKLI